MGDESVQGVLTGAGAAERRQCIIEVASKEISCFGRNFTFEGVLVKAEVGIATLFPQFPNLQRAGCILHF